MTTTRVRFRPVDWAKVLPCWACEGSGYQEPDTCPDCNGDNHDGDPCQRCDGTGTTGGYETCDHCFGDGADNPHPNTEAFMVALDTALGALANQHDWQIDFGTACCQSCAFSVNRDQQRPFVGFHEQDLEELARSGNEILLFHHLPDPTNPDTLVAVLEEHGFEVNWDRDLSRRPLIRRPS